METIEAFACRVSGVGFAAATEADLRRDVEGRFPGQFDGALVLHFCASVPAVAGRTGPAAPVRPPKSYVVRFPAGDALNYERQLAAYNAELAAAGWGYEESVMSEAQLANFAANYGDDARKLVSNYECGIITGGEFDMRVAELRGLIN